MSALRACLIGRRRRVLCLVLGTAGLLCPGAVQPLLARDTLPEGCVVVPGGDQASTQPQAPQGREPAAPPSVSPAPVPVKGAASEALRPPQERELEELGGVLKALAGPETSGAALAALGKGQPFSLERFGVLVADVRSIVVQLSARELRGRVLQSKKVDDETRHWIEVSVQTAEGCGPARFEDRGGPVVYEQVVALVSKHRRQLEAFVFPSPAPEPSPVQAPASPKAAP